MIRQLINQSALSAKVHAKLKDRLTNSDYEKMVNLTSLSELITYLRQFKSYKDALNGVVPEGIHRGTLERRLHNIKQKDIESLKRFGDNDVKKFLDLYRISFEIWKIKMNLRILLRNDENTVWNEDFLNLQEAKNLDELLNLLQGTEYHDVLVHKNTLFDMETALDNFYQKKFQEATKKYISKSERGIIKAFATEWDLNTLLFIIRAKINFDFSEEQIVRYIHETPCYHLKQSTLMELSRANDLETALSVARETIYKDLFTGQWLGIEKRIKAYVLSCHQKTFRLSPYSIESILYFIKVRETEIQNVVMITEGIRYKLPPQEIKSYLIGL